MKRYTYRLTLHGQPPQAFEVHAHDRHEAAGYAYSEAIRLGARPGTRRLHTNVVQFDLVATQTE